MPTDKSLLMKKFGLTREELDQLVLIRGYSGADVEVLSLRSLAHLYLELNRNTETLQQLVETIEGSRGAVEGPKYDEQPACLNLKWVYPVDKPYERALWLLAVIFDEDVDKMLHAMEEYSVAEILVLQSEGEFLKLQNPDPD